MTKTTSARSWVRLAAGLCAAAGLALAAGVLGARVLGPGSQAAAQAAASPTAVTAASLALPPRLAPGEVALVRQGLAAAQAGRWDEVAALRASARDPLAAKILTWREARDTNAPTSFLALAEAHQALQGWPALGSIRRRAEQMIFDAPWSAAERVAWLRAGTGPESGDGEIALAQALAQTGQRAEAVARAREAWRTRALTPRAESAALALFAGEFTAADHAARVDSLLWRGERTAAGRLLARLGPSDRLVAEARIALQSRKSKGLQAAVDRVPAARAADPGLVFDRVQYIRRDGRPERALVLAIGLDPMAAPVAAREKIAEERRLYVSRALREGNVQGAYRLVANHGLSAGVAFADSEWMAGWIKLRRLRDPAAAAAHFATLERNVGAPVSKSRALYWQAQAARALGDQAGAGAFLAAAAAFDYTFYGQIAKVAQTPGAALSFTAPAAPTPAQRTAFERRELVRALRVMMDAGGREDFEAIAFYLDDQLGEPIEHELLADLARAAGHARTAVRSAKAGIRRGIVAEQAAYPVISLASGAVGPGRPEPALTHAIIRQETEFDPHAISPAGARGLMQLMPGTAKLTAAREGFAYDRARLTSDPGYNVSLGTAYLGGLIDEFGGSYVMAIAAYNAGPSRPRQWMEDWGDPRTGAIDIIDWIELIPFGETRNYVQRVLENVQVYRYRLAGKPTAIRLDEDLRR